MDLLKSEPGSSNESCVTSALDANELIGIEAGRESDISEVADQEATLIPAIKAEPNVSGVPEMAAALRSYKRRRNVCSEISVITSQPRSLNDLPDEILLQILSHIGPEDLCLIIAKVCERWNTLAKDVVLWKTLSYHCYDSSDISRIKEVLTAAPTLHSLIIRQRGDATDILEFLFPIHVNFRKLILEYCYLGKDSTGLLANVMALYPDLEGLSLEGCYPITSAGYGHIVHLKKLSELNLSYSQGLSGQTFRLIADSCQHLKKLIMNRVEQFFDDDVFHVIKELGKQLTTLALDGRGLTDVGYSYLKNCASLKELRVTLCNKMTDRGLLEGIGSLHELTSLLLHVCVNVTAQAWSNFLHRPSMNSIVLLELSQCCNLDDEGLKGIAERCIHLKELKLFLCGCVTDAGISMVISHCNQLCVLNLMDLKHITGEGWLAQVPSHLTHLRELCLAGCDNVRDKYVFELLADVPELSVIMQLGDIVGAVRNRHLEATYECSTSDVDGIIKQRALADQSEDSNCKIIRKSESCALYSCEIMHKACFSVKLNSMSTKDDSTHCGSVMLRKWNDQHSCRPLT